MTHPSSIPKSWKSAVLHHKKTFWNFCLWIFPKFNLFFEKSVFSLNSIDIRSQDGYHSIGVNRKSIPCEGKTQAPPPYIFGTSFSNGSHAKRYEAIRMIFELGERREGPLCSRFKIIQIAPERFAWAPREVNLKMMSQKYTEGGGCLSFSLTR